MALLIVNGDITTEGKISVSRTLRTNDQGKAYVVIQGQLVMPQYVEEINDIEADNFAIEGMNVYEEDFGSEDSNIIYNFTAEKFFVKGYKESGGTKNE
jgi:hypothetical protein